MLIFFKRVMHIYGKLHLQMTSKSPVDQMTLASSTLHPALFASQITAHILLSHMKNQIFKNISLV